MFSCRTLIICCPTHPFPPVIKTIAMSLFVLSEKLCISAIFVLPLFHHYVAEYHTLFFLNNQLIFISIIGCRTPPLIYFGSAFVKGRVPRILNQFTTKHPDLSVWLYIGLRIGFLISKSLVIMHDQYSFTQPRIISGRHLMQVKYW